MDMIKIAIDAFREFGAGNTALLMVLLLFAWFFVKILPVAVERVVIAMESLGKAFAVHDERAMLLYQVMSSVQAELQALKVRAVTQESIQRIHERIDKAILTVVTKDDMKNHNLEIKAALEAISDALVDHGNACERRSDRLEDKVVNKQ